MSLSTAQKIHFVIGLIDFGGLFIFIGTALYLAYTKMDFMLHHLRNCPAIINRRDLRNGGPRANLVLMGEIMGALAMPHLSLRNGGISADDLKSFPAGLRRILVTLYWLGWTCLIVMFVFCAVTKLELV